LRTPTAAEHVGQAANKLDRQIEPVKVILRRSLGMEVAWLKAPVPSDVRALIRALISLTRGSDYSKRRRRARPAAGGISSFLLG
jgi:hypothetical protein